MSGPCTRELAAAIWLVLASCGPSASGQGEQSAGAGSSGLPAGSDAAPPQVDAGASSVAPGSTDDGVDPGATTIVASSGETGPRDPSEGESSTGALCEQPLACGGQAYACGNGRDDDGDDLVDLADPECTSVCDDDEGSFASGLPDDNGWARVDCMFDGNTGHGDDGCLHDPCCDPLEPFPPCGAGSSKRNCSNSPTLAPRECVAFCEPFVPNGCDCFGCCTFATPDGPKNFFLEWDECTLADDLAGCMQCTQQIELCGNPCEVEACEVCIGQLAPAEGCAAPACVGGTACVSNCDCPRGEGCITGCCVPTPP